jgi:aromatic ring hydroxylase
MYMHVPRGRLVAGLDHDDRLVTVRLLENVARAENLRYHSHQCGSLERMLWHALVARSLSSWEVVEQTKAFLCPLNYT